MLCAVFSLCYVQSLVCVACSLFYVLCADFSLSYVQSLVHVIYRPLSVLCAFFRVCYVPTLVSSVDKPNVEFVKRWLGILQDQKGFYQHPFKGHPNCFIIARPMAQWCVKSKCAHWASISNDFSL